MEKRFDTDKYESGYIPSYVEKITTTPRRILEVGVNRGGSLLLWCDLWPTVQYVIGLDISEPPEDRLHPKVTIFQGDQTDMVLLNQIGSDYGSFDLVIDDASHLGTASWTTFRTLWPHVADGGVYVVEDWATGYTKTWPDGEDYVDTPPPGHIAGMVGMVKRLVDEVHYGNVQRIEFLRGLVFIYKKVM
jgi:hypothetical protein